MERRQRQRRVTDYRPTPAEHEADVRAVMVCRLGPWLRSKGIDAERKVCTGCHALVPLTDFYRRATSRDGRMASCKACRRAWDQAHRAERRLQPAPRRQ